MRRPSQGGVNLRGVIVRLWTCASSPRVNYDSDHLLAIGSVGERMLILLDIEETHDQRRDGRVAQTLQ